MKVERDELVGTVKKYIKNESQVSVITMRIMGLDYGSKTVGVAVSDWVLLRRESIVRRKSES